MKSNSYRQRYQMTLFMLAAYVTLAVCFVYWPLAGRERYERKAAPMMEVVRGPVEIAPGFVPDQREWQQFNPMTGKYERRH